MQGEEHTRWTWTRAIPEQRDRLQSKILVWVVGGVLAAGVVFLLAVLVSGEGLPGKVVRHALVLSALFSLLSWRLRAATGAAALWGGCICLLLAVTPIDQGVLGPVRTAVAPLLMLFLLTFGATRFAKKRGVRTDEQESRRGRRASQVLANLGGAGLIALANVFLQVFHYGSARRDVLGMVLLAASLAEASADTVASELGQALGGPPRLIGSFRVVAPGTDGAVTVYGTLAGLGAAGLISCVSAVALPIAPRQAVTVFAAGAAGLFFDSVLGATVERRGWLGNDLVNFCSVGFAVAVAALLLAVAGT